MGKYKTVNMKEPLNNSRVVLDSYWLVKDDLTKAVFFESMPQCNKHKRIPERVMGYIEKQTGWHLRVIYAPIAYIPSC